MVIQIPPAFLDAMIRWFAYQQSVAIKNGRKLTFREIELAKAIGIEYPENVRIAFVDQMPKVKSPVLLQVMDQAGFSFGDAYGLCLGYGIFIKTDGKGDHRVLAHELTHTFQFERFLGTRGFLTNYIQQFLTHGYHMMPLEKEARSNEKLGTSILGK